LITQRQHGHKPANSPLKPVLVEINGKLDLILQKVEDLLAQLDIDGIHALLARLEEVTGAVQCDSAPELEGSQEQ
jgi:hypothetical protein